MVGPICASVEKRIILAPFGTCFEMQGNGVGNEGFKHTHKPSLCIAESYCFGKSERNKFDVGSAPK